MLVVFTARCTLVQSAVLRSHVVCLSVRPSVTLVDCDHIGWSSSKIISRLVSLGCSLSADPNIGGLLQGKHPKILGQSDPLPVDLSVGDIRSQIAAAWLWSQWTDMPSRYANGHISATDDPIHFIFGSRVGFSGSADRMALFLVTSNPR